MAEWQKNQDDTYSARAGAYTLKVWQSAQFKSWGWSAAKGHICKAGDSKTLEQAQKAAEAAVETSSKG